MEEENKPIKRQYRKAKEDDRRKVTSKLNLEKARQKKLEMLSIAREKENQSQESSDSNSSDSNSSDSDSDVIVIAPKKKGKKKEKENKKTTKVKKRSGRGAVTKKQVIKIVNPTPPQQAPPAQKESDIEFFKRMLLSQHK